MTTLAELADRAQITLNDAGASTWPQATIESWVIDAIRDYSQTFPRTVTSDSEIGADPDHQLDLSVDILAVTMVECPGDRDPPVLLKRRKRTHPEFYNYEGFYDYELSNDATQAGQLYLSQIPTEGEAIYITTIRHHDTDLQPNDTITVPDHHEQILILYVLWQAFRERIATEEQDPDTTLAGAVTLLQQLIKGAQQAEKEYHDAIERAKALVSDGSFIGPWTMDQFDPIY